MSEKSVPCNDYSAWLIEIAEIDGPTYFQFKLDDDWTKDHNKALHFSRKEDAESVIDFYGWTRAKAVDHLWPQLTKPPENVSCDPVSNGGESMKAALEAFECNGIGPKNCHEDLVITCKKILGHEHYETIRSALLKQENNDFYNQVMSVLDAGSDHYKLGYEDGVRDAQFRTIIKNEQGQVIGGHTERGREPVPYIPTGTQDYCELVKALKFPVMLRKMWSGGEVQKWIDEQIAKYKGVKP